MPNTGYQLTGTAANVASLGEDWTNATNAQTESDSAATVALTAVNNQSDNLRCTNFDFGRLDSSDSIIGISVQCLVGLSVGADNDGGLSLLQLTLAGSLIGSDQISGTDNLVAAFTLLTFGGPTNLMGASPSITNAQTNTFGFEITADQVANTPTVAVRFARMAIHVANSQTFWSSRSRSTVRTR